MKPASEKEKTPGKVVTLDIVERRRTRRLKFNSEEDKRGWEKAYRKSKLYMPYFLLGVGINFILYLSGLDLAKNLLLGGTIGIAVPMAAMFILSELHYRIFYEEETANGSKNRSAGKAKPAAKRKRA
ncbi:MAG: hypothetical protein K6T80_05515 [Firmicutes bacterium]|nr:hypothetical protein [Bacillota bacterium]